MHQSFLVYKGFRYLKVALILSALSIFAYAVYIPTEPPNGGTWLGYTLGTIGALLILWLLWFGVRKRKFSRGSATTQSWLSAHVYLGMALLLVATLHSGFQFAWNLHMLAYSLMVIVIASGIFGIVAYARYPSLITANRESQTREQMFEEIANLDQAAVTLAAQIGDQAHQIILRSINRTKIGGSVWAQISGKEQEKEDEMEEEQLVELATQMMPAIGSPNAPTMAMPSANADPDSESTLFFVAQNLAGSHGQERVQKLRDLLDIVRSKKMLVDRLRRDIRYHGLMQLWLYVHVPLSLALLAALTAHIIAVFFYW
ncbi:MAG: hypothetical protein KDH88_07720 [Chromatiales bacterium]|nr:hypothetical protein [Chromatiales bacterium]